MCYYPTTGSCERTSAGIVFGRDEYNLRVCWVLSTNIKRGVSTRSSHLRRGFCCLVLKPIVGSKRFQVSISLYTMAKTATTARLNVGGFHFEVSRSLIVQHDSSMLARLVSDTWQADPEAIIFIDRDGETFRHCLDFLRYGRVSLPLTVARDAFLRDMDYYGIEVDASLIGVAGPVVQGATCVLNRRKHMKMETIAIQEEIASLARTTQAETKRLQARIASLEITDECFARYSLDGSLHFQFHKDPKNPSSKEHKLYVHAETVYESQESFVEYLGKYGFGLKRMQQCGYMYKIDLKIAAPTGANAN